MIWVFVGHTGHFVGFVMWWLKLCLICGLFKKYCSDSLWRMKTHPTFFSISEIQIIWQQGRTLRFLAQGPRLTQTHFLHCNNRHFLSKCQAQTLGAPGYQAPVNFQPWTGVINKIQQDHYFLLRIKWVPSRQNQQNDCAPSEDSDQPGHPASLFVCLCWGLTSQSTIFQSCRDEATASWIINQYFRGVKCLAQGHNTAAVGLEPPTSRSGVQHSTTEPPRSFRQVWSESSLSAWRKLGSLATYWAHSKASDQSGWIAQADQSLCWAHSHFVGFVMRQLKYWIKILLNKYM